MNPAALYSLIELQSGGVNNSAVLGKWKTLPHSSKSKSNVNYMEIKRIVPNIPSSKMEESKKFYTDFLGLKLAMDMGWIMTFISENNPLVQLSIIKKETTPKINEEITITIEIPNAEELFQIALDTNYEIIYPLTKEPWGVKRFFVKGPNGVVLNIMSHI